MYPISPKNYTKKGKAEKNRHSRGERKEAKRNNAMVALSVFIKLLKNYLGSSVLKNPARLI